MLIIKVYMASNVKKIKLSKAHQQSSFLERIEKKRRSEADSVVNFQFNKKRVKILSKKVEVPDECKGIVYWMSRDCRVQDNWAFLFAQKLALKNEVPLHGLQEVARECLSLNIPFHLLDGHAHEVLPTWIKKNEIGAVVCDFSPLRLPIKWYADLEKTLPNNVPFVQVDAHNIVPCWITSDKMEFAARTIRNKINSKLSEFLTEYPPIIKHPFTSTFHEKNIDWEATLESRDVDKCVRPCEWAEPGTNNGFKILREFCENRLKVFASARNNPLINALSNMSPWFHFGQVSVQRAVLCVQEYKLKYTEGVNAFCEEAIIRRELADNFCFYNEHYDSIKGASDWAQKTLSLHRNDKRTYIYTREQLDKGLTHDDLWNSAQLQLINEGKMHGFLRMYWAKKILEWTPSPETALEYAIFLNDRYSLDGRDPSGYVGCMWSICGTHDQGWAERPIFGKIRYMNYEGCKRKFNIKEFITKYGGKST